LSKLALGAQGLPKAKPRLLEAIGASGEYFLFGSVCLVDTFFVIFIMRESKDKSNEDMRNYFLERAGKKTKYKYYK
jgi:hypothetical protein